MSNFLTRWTKPASPRREKQTVAPRAEFQDAVAAFRKATGKPETRTIPCRCAVTGQVFTIVFERLSPAHRFQIARIEQEDGGSDRGIAGGGRPGRNLLLKSYDAAEFDWAGYICPHCANRAGTVYCGQCRETVCAGRVRPLPDGTKSFACHDGCGFTGTTEPSSHVHGGRITSGPAPAQASRLPAPAATQRLTYRPAPRLPGRQPQ